MDDTALEKFIGSYASFFDSIGALTAIMFAATTFYLSRQLGLVKGEDVPTTGAPGLLIFAMLCCMTSGVAVFLAKAQIASFYDDLMQNSASVGCTLPIEGRDRMSIEATYFQDCTRPFLGWFNIASISCSVGAGILLLVWVLRNVRKVAR